MKTFVRALKFAAEAHKGQTRKDIKKTPYINHPIDVVDILTRVGVVDEQVLASAILHDVIEDTRYGHLDLLLEFNKTIADLVLEVSDDRKLSSKERKLAQIEHAKTISDNAKLIKIADKLANVRDVLHSYPEGWDKEKRLEYIEWAKEVVDNAKGGNEELDEWFYSVYSFKSLIN